MIKLTHLGGGEFIVNAELIRYVEQRPDTFVTMTDGDRFVVQESLDEVVARAVEYQRQKHMIPAPLRSVASPDRNTFQATSLST